MLLFKKLVFKIMSPFLEQDALLKLLKKHGIATEYKYEVTEQPSKIFTNKKSSVTYFQLLKVVELE